MSNSRLPPHDEQAEQAVLGCILIDSDAILSIIDKLQPSDFYIVKHKALYAAMQKLYNDSQSIDLVTLPSMLGDKFKNIDAYIIDLINVVPTSIDIESYAEIVYEKSKKRELIKIASQIAQIGHSDKIAKDAIVEAQAAILTLDNGNKSGGLIEPYNHASAYIDKILYRHANPDVFNGIPTGFADLDKVLDGGLANGVFHVISGRPGMGKTALAINIIMHNAIMLGKKVAFFSLEMPAVQVNDRIVSKMSGVEASRLKHSRFDNDEELTRVMDCVNTLSGSGLFIDESSTLNAIEIRTRCQKMMIAHGLDLIVVDYLQIMSHIKGLNENEQITETCKILRTLAKELKVPILLLCQLNRAVEARASKRPSNADLRGSGSIEQDAYTILHLYRDEVYNPDTTEKPNVAEVIIGKNRSGPCLTVELYWNGTFTSFANLQKREVQL